MVAKRQGWRSYATGSEVRHFADFAREHLIQSEDRWEGKPLRLEPWQRRMLGEALAYDEHGQPVWRSVVMVAPRKNAKTMLLAAVDIYRLLTDEGRPEILLAASSDRQAGRLFDACARYVRRNPALSDLLRVRDHEGSIVREDGMGAIIRLTSDPARLYGYSPTLVVVDELAFWTTPTLRRAYAALTSGGGARSAPQTFTITTAGEASTRHDSILGTLSMRPSMPRTSSASRG
jgi:phage terminase large subunit-like protein